MLYLLDRRTLLVGSKWVSDDAMKRACYVVRFVLADRNDVRQIFYQRYGRVAIIAGGSKLSDIPEYRFLTDKQNYDDAAQGLGAIRIAPVSTARENNVLCYRNATTEEDILFKVCWYFGRCVVIIYIYIQ